MRSLLVLLLTSELELFKLSAFSSGEIEEVSQGDFQDDVADEEDDEEEDELVLDAVSDVVPLLLIEFVLVVVLAVAIARARAAAPAAAVALILFTIVSGVVAISALVVVAAAGGDEFVAADPVFAPASTAAPETPARRTFDAIKFIIVFNK